MIGTQRPARLLTYLDGSQHAVDEVGGKAVGLDLLLRHDYPVPEAAVITTAAYHDVATETSVQLLIDDLATASLPTPDRIAAEAAAIDRVFLAAPISSRVTAALDRICEELLGEGPVAVRSSATAEDLAEASFAGQYLTITDITTAAELERAVRRCWASLWMPSARAYRNRHRISEKSIAMAVVVQRQIVADWSGVVFTTDPQGREHLIRIEAVEGMGEQLVSGRVTPADYLVRKDTLEILEPTDYRRLPFLEDLARLALRVERSLGAAQDIEWATDEVGLHLLQVRPITGSTLQSTLNDGFDTDPTPGATYTPHGVIEMLPAVVPPLLWTINAPMLENAFRSTFADLGGRSPSCQRRLVSRFRGRAALDLSAICSIAASLPGGDPAEVERQYLGKTISDNGSSGATGTHLFAALRSRTAQKRIVDEVHLTTAAAQTIARLDIELAGLPVRNLVAYRQRIRDLAWRGYAAEVGASSAAGATYRALEVLLGRWMPEDEATTWAQVLSRQSIDDTVLSGMRVAGLLDVLTNHSTPEIRRLIDEGPSDIRDRISNIPNVGPRFLDALARAARRMGSKAVYGDVSWVEDDIWIWRHLQILNQESRSTSATRSSRQEVFSDLQHRLASDKKWRRARLLTGQFVDLRIRWLKRQVEETTHFLRLREEAKNALLVLGGEERRIIVEASGRLVASRQLSQADHVLYLTDAELDGMMFGSCGVDRAEIESRRETSIECATAPPLPDWFNGSPITTGLEDVANGDRLSGWATSPGQATGVARIIASLEDGMRMQKGDVLVAHATDPSWTPLFLTAGAVVLETGGPLAHAAIVAREFGLPAVLNVPRATRTLVDGESVLVNGTLGFVDRLDQKAKT